MTTELAAFLDGLRHELRTQRDLDAEVAEVVITRLLDGADLEGDGGDALLALETIALRRASAPR